MKDKRFLATFSALVLLSGATLFAQEAAGNSGNGSNSINLELYAGYGVATSNTFVAGVAETIGGIFDAISDSMQKKVSDGEDGATKTKTLKFHDSGAFILGLNYHFNKVLYAGALGTFEYFEISGGDDWSAFSVLANLGVNYGWKYVKFYHELGAGMCGFITSERNIYLPAMNLTWLGLKVQPAPHFWLYAESSVGPKGLLTAGLRWKF